MKIADRTLWFSLTLLPLLALLCVVSGCASTLENVEGFAMVRSPVDKSPIFATFVRGDIQTGFIYYGADGDAGLRDAQTKFRYTLPIEGLEVGTMRYWDKRNGVDEDVPIGALLPPWVRGLMTPDEAKTLRLTFQDQLPDPPSLE